MGSPGNGGRRGDSREKARTTAVLSRGPRMRNPLRVPDEACAPDFYGGCRRAHAMGLQNDSGEGPARRPREVPYRGKHHGKAPGTIKRQRDLEPCRGSLVRCPISAPLKKWRRGTRSGLRHTVILPSSGSDGRTESRTRARASRRRRPLPKLGLPQCSFAVTPGTFLTLA